MNALKLSEVSDSDMLRSLHRESFSWALSCCGGDRESAEEVLQNVYVKVLDGSARFEGASSFKTWLFSVIRRSAAERRRSFWSLSRFVSLLTEGEAMRPPALLPDEALGRRILRRRFRESLAHLPERQREVLNLVFGQDLSLSEAAAVMSISVGSARTHYERGKAALRPLLKARGSDDGI